MTFSRLSMRALRLCVYFDTRQESIVFCVAQWGVKNVETPF